MIANYGYTDGSGAYLISVDTDRCTGCGDCIPACPQGLFEVVENPFDPLSDVNTVVVREEHRKKLKYSCAVCKSTSNGSNLPCTDACGQEALTHSW